jgi:hypothetical protein
VATGGDDSTTKLWVTAALEDDVRQERASTEGHTAPVTALSIHPLVRAHQHFAFNRTLCDFAQ